MSALINRVKEHISNNRGKYGAAAGAGAMYGASKIDSPLLNQAGFNILAKGQNLALDAAEKIDPRAVSKLNDLGLHNIRPEDIDASNALYNSGLSKYINPNPVDMVNANEHSTEAYNKAMALKADAQDALDNAKTQGQDYIEQGTNFVKGLNPFTESTNFRGNTMQIQIKKALLEGHTPEVIVEAVHANHPGLDKRNPANDDSRRMLAHMNRSDLRFRNSLREKTLNPTHYKNQEANLYDNSARNRSQTGDIYFSHPANGKSKELKEIKNMNTLQQIVRSAPRIISSAKQ